MKNSKRLKTYAKITLGTAGALSAGDTADAGIVYFDVAPDQTINQITNPQQVSFGNIDLTYGTFQLNSTAGKSFLLAYNSSFFYVLGGSIDFGLSASTKVSKLSAGTTINGALTSAWNNSYVNFSTNAGSLGNWAGNNNAYAALRISAAGGNFHYGWANIITSTSAKTATITGFAFESTANTAIQAGAIPEPSTHALLLLTGMAGYFASRRRAGAVTEPKALHDLALGARGIAEFRGNREA